MKKIVVIGPESTGKSTLCAALAQRFNSLWCPEFARAYLLENGSQYTYDTLLEIAKGQLELEDKTVAQAIAENRQFVFIDTDMYVMRIWAEYVYNKCPYAVLDEIVRRKYDFYLLTNTDLPWQPDELRELPDLQSRKEIFNYYVSYLSAQDTPWKIVSGTGEVRLQNAVNLLLQSVG